MSDPVNIRAGWPTCSPPNRRAASSVAGLGAGVGEGLPCDGDKLPIETRRVQGELHNAKSRIVAHQAVGCGRGVEGEVADSPCSGDDLNDTPRHVQIAVRVLRGESFVVMRMGIEDEISVGVIEVLPEGQHAGVGAD